MSCSAYGMAGPAGQYSNYPQYQASFYQAPNNDPFNNLTNSNMQQAMQLNLNTLMPASWNAASAAQSADSDPKSDWERYSVSRDGVQRYISASGASRYSQIDRSSAGRRFGEPNLLRSQPPAALTIGSSPWFNDSSDRQALVDPAMNAWIGCGQ